MLSGFCGDMCAGKPGDERGTTETIGTGPGGTLSPGGTSKFDPTAKSATEEGPSTVTGSIAQAAKDLYHKAAETLDDVTPTVP